ncbi:MAG: heavy-metal-associated domain-containing protein [Nitrospirae bacterium]|nr:MAG: heavy-metal-associated domain-containing protein [Nitrospirota bacterium]
MAGLCLFCAGACESESPLTHPTQVVLALSGNNCEFYQGAVKEALVKLSGVTEVDFMNQPGRVLVTTDGTLTPSQVAEAVDGLSGEGWTCEATVIETQ